METSIAVKICDRKYEESCIFYSQQEDKVLEMMRPILNYASKLYEAEVNFDKEAKLHNTENSGSLAFIDHSTSLIQKIKTSAKNKISFREFSTNFIPLNKKSHRFLVSSKEENRREPFIFQLPREPRTKFMLRFPHIWAECINSGHLTKFKSLLMEFLIDSCIFHTLTIPPIAGWDNIYETFVETLRNSPDFYLVMSNIKQLEKRMISLQVNSFGTLPFVNMEPSLPTLYQLVPSVSELNDSYKLQKANYEDLRSQQKVIKFKGCFIYCIHMDRDVKKVKKIVARQAKIEFFES